MFLEALSLVCTLPQSFLFSEKKAPRIVEAFNLWVRCRRRFFSEKWAPYFWKPLTCGCVAASFLFSEKWPPYFLEAPDLWLRLCRKEKSRCLESLRKSSEGDAQGGSFSLDTCLHWRGVCLAPRRPGHSHWSSECLLMWELAGGATCTTNKVNYSLNHYDCCELDYMLHLVQNTNNTTPSRLCIWFINSEGFLCGSISSLGALGEGSGWRRRRRRRLEILDFAPLGLKLKNRVFKWLGP